MTGIRAVLMASAFVAIGAGVAEANQPPGPQMLLAEVGVLPLMILLSLAGGAYAVLRAIRPGARRWTVLRTAGAILAILLSGTSSGFALPVALIFGVIALQRGAQMVRWGLQSRRSTERPAHLASADSGRLLVAGLVLLVCTTALMGMVVAFAGYWNRAGSEGDRQQALRQFVAYELAMARQTQATTGKARFGPSVPPSPPSSVSTAAVRPPAGARLEFAPDGSGFTLLLFPQVRFPFFPYNHLTTQPSYRADSTGRIRMVMVHDRDTPCPPDAPVVAQVSEADVERMLRLLGGAGEGR